MGRVVGFTAAAVQPERRDSIHARRATLAHVAQRLLRAVHRGGVFSAATIAYSSALAVDPVAAQVLRNVLDRFEGRQLARCVQRTGSGINPLEFACTTLPSLGTSWTTSIATSPLTQDTLLLLAAQPAQLPLFGGELLVAVVPPPLVQRALGNHVVPIPNLPALLGARAHAQGLRIDGVGPTTRLTMLNAQQLTFGY